ncbi:MAG: sensor histidine kinase [Cyclobacteriaceae bacterium]
MIEIGCLLFVAVYHIILYFQIRRNYYLYLGLLVFMVFIRALLVDDGSGFLYELIPSMDRLTGRKIEYFASYSAILLTPLFINDLFNYYRFRKIVRFFAVEGIILMGIVLLSPLSFYRNTLNIFHVSMVGVFVLVFFILYTAIRKKKTGSRHILFGVIVCFVFVFVEMLKNSQLIPYFDPIGPNLVNTGVLFYFFFQSIALSAIYARSFRENEKLNTELDERVSARTEQLSQSNLVKERFIRIVSHDLRGPLSNLKSMLALLDDGTISEKQSKELIEKINKNVTGSLEMLDDLMEWTKTTAQARLKIYRERFDIIDIIEETFSFFKEDVTRKKILLNLNANVRPVYIESDKNAIKVILRNLISNGIKFTESGGEVTITVDGTEKGVIVSVADTGIGITDGMKHSIFEMNPGNKRSGTENEQSTGVGLSLTWDLVGQNGGQIRVEDNDPKGTIFKLSLDHSAPKG